MAAFDQVSAAFAEHSGTFDVLISIGMTVAQIFGGVIIAAIITFANVIVGVITTAIGIVTDIINGLVGVLTGIITFITDVFACDWTLAKAGEILGVGRDAGDTFLSIVGRGGAEPAMSASPISITLNFNGDIAPEKVKQAVMDAGRQVQRTFAEQMENYRRERGRLAFG